MTGIEIYIEGGGDAASSKADLRRGFDTLLERQKTAARAQRLRWQVALCGGRNATLDAFARASKTAGSQLIVLLVDAEAPVANSTPAGRVAHLNARDGWTLVADDADRIHLMTQCMEAWLAADANAFTAFYGQGFHTNALPKRQKLDEEPKQSLYSALDAATRHTKHGNYSKGKIRHARELLRLLNPTIVAERCESFRQLTTWLDAVIAAA